jgi:hypothetical protein
MHDDAVREDEQFDYPIDGVLDLHTFNPREVKELLKEYVAACRQRGIFEIRVIHGKGTGVLWGDGALGPCQTAGGCFIQTCRRRRWRMGGHNRDIEETKRTGSSIGAGKIVLLSYFSSGQSYTLQRSHRTLSFEDIHLFFIPHQQGSCEPERIDRNALEKLRGPRHQQHPFAGDKETVWSGLHLPPVSGRGFKAGVTQHVTVQPKDLLYGIRG